MPAGSAQTDVTCYRHPDRPAPLGCTRCGRPICLDDAIDAPVGFLCPECARQPASVRRAQRRVAAAAGNPRATTVLLVVIGLVFLGQMATQLDLGGRRVSELVLRGGLNGGAVAAGEWWRVVASGFLHSDGLLLHVGFNAYLLWQLGKMLEPGIGSTRFLAIYVAGLFGGGAGALLLDWNALTIGASGAVFGLMGGAMVLMRRRGINPWRTGIGTLVIINLVFTFAAPGVSIGGHLGGLLGGALAAVPMTAAHVAAGRDTAIAWGAAAVLGVVAVVLGVAGPLL